jgi:glucose-1-phosphate thymidylyltransferase
VYDVWLFELAKSFWCVSVDQNNFVNNFVEKPAQPETTLISTLLYYIKKESLYLVKWALEAWFWDRSGDFIKYLLQYAPLNTYKIQWRWFDIGTLDQYNEADSYLKGKA